MPSLIERMTGIGRSRPAAPPAAPRTASQSAASGATQPAGQPPRPRRSSAWRRSKSRARKPRKNKEDELLDIPAFLRRQAN